MFSKFQFAIITSIFLLVIFAFFTINNSNKLLTLKDEYSLQQAKTKTMRMHVKKLKTEFINFTRNHEFVEAYLRENMGYGKKNELIFVFND